MAALEPIRQFFWGPPSLDRSLLTKLDLTLLPYLSLMWFLFGINRSSYSTAYISGMDEDLGFKGKDYNYMNTIYIVFYAVSQIPSTSLLTVFPPKWIFVGCNLVWSILTLVTFRATHVYQIFILNGFEGAFAAVCYVGGHFIYGSWYKKSELGTRAAIFCCFGHLGSMVGRWLQAALLKSLDGRGGLPAWRWLFIIVSIITIPIVAFGWVVIPNLPVHKSAWYLTEEEKQWAIDRLGKPQKQTWDLTVFRRVLTSWQFYLLPLIFMLYSLCVQSLGNNVMALWMKSRGYNVIQQNNYPSGIYGTAILGTVLYAIWSDSIQSRWQPSLSIGATFVVGSAILAANPSNDGVIFFAFYLLGTTYAPQALWYSWMADVTAHDLQLRAITTGWMNSFDFAFVTWWCPTKGSNNTTVLDVLTPNAFDNKYYVDLRNRRGLFTSDQDLFTDRRTRPIVQSFAANQNLFFEKFVFAMIKMSQLSVLTGKQGEIRSDCSVRNPGRTYLASVVDGEEEDSAV